MTRTVTAAAFCSLIAVAKGQAHFRVYDHDRVVGEASLSQRITADGGKISELSISLELNGRRVRVVTRSQFDRAALPVRKVVDVIPEGKAPARQVIVSFDHDGANVVVKEKGVPRASHVAIVETANRKNEFEFWFLRDVPKVGQRTVGYTFNVNHLEWDLTQVTYTGKVPGGRRVTWEAADRTIETVVDEAGLPVSITDPAGFRLVRTR